MGGWAEVGSAIPLNRCGCALLLTNRSKRWGDRAVRRIFPHRLPWGIGMRDRRAILFITIEREAGTRNALAMKSTSKKALPTYPAFHNTMQHPGGIAARNRHSLHPSQTLLPPHSQYTKRESQYRAFFSTVLSATEISFLQVSKSSSSSTVSTLRCRDSESRISQKFLFLLFPLSPPKTSSSPYDQPPPRLTVGFPSKY